MLAVPLLHLYLDLQVTDSCGPILSPKSRGAGRIGGGAGLSRQAGPLRGDLRKKSRQEMLQNSYLAAVAAAAGCTMAKPEPDDGTDFVLTHRSEAHAVDVEVDLKIQLKSKIVTGPKPPSGYISVPLKNNRFKMMAASPVTTARIVVAMALPDCFDEWIDASHEVFKLRHCAYWVNIEGWEPTGKTSTSVRVPTAQIFDDIALCAIMKRLGQGGSP